MTHTVNGKPVDDDQLAALMFAPYNENRFPEWMEALNQQSDREFLTIQLAQLMVQEEKTGTIQNLAIGFFRDNGKEQIAEKIATLIDSGLLKEIKDAIEHCSEYPIIEQRILYVFAKKFNKECSINTSNVFTRWIRGIIERTLGRTMRLQSFTGLRSLNIFCSKYLGSLDLQELPHLQTLTIGECPELASITNVTGNAQSCTFRDCAALKSITTDPQMNNLERLNIHSCYNLRHLSGMQQCGQLQELYLRGSPYEFLLDMLRKGLTQLKTLSIRLKDTREILLPVLPSLKELSAELSVDGRDKSTVVRFEGWALGQEISVETPSDRFQIFLNNGRTSDNSDQILENGVSIIHDSTLQVSHRSLVPGPGSESTFHIRQKPEIPDTLTLL